MTFASAVQSSHQRSPVQLGIRIFVTHFIAVGNYASLCQLQRRPWRGFQVIIRLVFFLFVPPLILVELLHDLLQTLSHIVKRQADQQDIDLPYHVSIFLGLNATTRAGEGIGRNRVSSVPLAKVDEDMAEKTRIPLNWTWAGRLALTLFILDQGLGTMIIWIRRNLSDEARCFLLDDRDAYMAIASTIISVQSLIILGLRYKWFLNQELPPAFEATTRRNVYRDLLAKAMIAILLDGIIHSHGDSVLNGPLSPAFPWRVVLNILNFRFGISAIFLIGIIVVFRNDIAQAIGVLPAIQLEDHPVIEKPEHGWKVLMTLVIVVYMLITIFGSFVREILQAVDYSYIDEYWWQDPIARKLIFF